MRVFPYKLEIFDFQFHLVLTKFELKFRNRDEILVIRKFELKGFETDLRQVPNISQYFSPNMKKKFKFRENSVVFQKLLNI